jgi:hypothetical protein
LRSELRVQNDNFLLGSWLFYLDSFHLVIISDELLRGGAALEGMARQPEQAGKLQTAMLIAAALVEGLAFAALFAVN